MFRTVRKEVSLLTINERIRYLRKDELGLTQAEFAEKLGLKQGSFSSIESGNATVTDRTVKAICMVFNVREEWLRTGEGEMYSPEPVFSLDRFVAERGATELELAIVKAYFELDPATRRTVLEHFKARLASAVTDEDEAEAEALKQDYLREMNDETAGYPAKLYFNYTDGTKKRIDFSTVTWHGLPEGKTKEDYDKEVSFWGSERTASKKQQLETNLPSISSGLVGDGVKVKNRYLMPIASTTLSASGGKLQNSYGF